MPASLKTVSTSVCVDLVSGTADITAAPDTSLGSRMLDVTVAFHDLLVGARRPRW
ncbi:MAG: hypothetical protein H0V41_05505 [Pseudonocardiales bacterium]|nr:hypothetical protein [Pseudonocardiales bacterium]